MNRNNKRPREESQLKNYNEYLLEIRDSIKIINDNINNKKLSNEGYIFIYKYLIKLIKQYPNDFEKNIINSLKIINYFFNSYQFFITQTKLKKNIDLKSNTIQTLYSVFPKNQNIPKIVHEIIYNKN